MSTLASPAPTPPTPPDDISATPPPAAPPVRTTSPPPPPKKKGHRWWFWAIVITALIGVGLWWLFKPSNAKAQGGTTPSEEFRRQPHGTTNEVAELRQQLAELSARLASLTSNSSPATIVAPSTNTTPIVTGLGGTTTNVYSTVVSSNISGVVITAGGGVNYTIIITNMPAGMVVMSLAPWPAWVKTNPTNSFTAPGPKIEVGKVTTLKVFKGCALEITLENGYMLYPESNDLKRVRMVYGNQLGCLVFDPDKHFKLPTGEYVRCLIWLAPDSPEEAVEFRFMVVPKQ